MKKILILFIIFIGFSVFSQNSGSILPSLNVPSVDLDPSVVIGLKDSPVNQWKVILKDSIKWETYNINGLSLYVYNKGDLRYPIANGTSSQYIAGDGAKIEFPTIPTNNNQLINGSGYLTSEVDGSVTNELELPNQTGQSGKFLQTNGTSVSWVDTSNQNISLTGDITGSGATSISTTLSNTGVTAGGYGYVTVDSKGRVLSGKRLEPYTGTTSGSGAYTVTYSTAYPTIPNVQPVIRNQTNVNQFALLTSSTTTGFTITTYQRNTTTLLAVEVLLSSVSTVNGLTLDVIVTEK